MRELKKKVFNIYIAKGYKSIPLGLILAESKEVAHAFFFGKYGAFDSIEEIVLKDLEERIDTQPFFNIIETIDKQQYDLRVGQSIRSVCSR